MEIQHLHSVKSLAAELGVAQSTLRRRLDADKLPYATYGLGEEVAFLPAHVQAIASRLRMRGVRGLRDGVKV